MVIHKCVVKNPLSPFKKELICINTSNYYVLTLKYFLLVCSAICYTIGVNIFCNGKIKILFYHLCTVYMMFQCLRTVKQ